MSYQPHPAERISHHTDRARFLDRLRPHFPEDAVLSEPEDLRPYECDGLSAYRVVPWLVVLPETVEQVLAVLRLCREHGVPVVARGAGTGLSGGALPVENGVLLSLAKFTRILAIDPDNRCARVQPGVRNLAVSEAAAPYGLYYAPDPSSQIACTIGGNVAENSGGVHCLKYGLTVHNVLEVKLATLDGELVTLGGGGLDAAGYDLLALVCGSEGLLGVIVEIIVKLLPLPPRAQAVLAAFDSIETAGAAVAAVIAAGLLPAGLELMDNTTLRAVEAYLHPGYPEDAAALVLCELDGLPEQVAADIEQAEAVLRAGGALAVRRSRSETERKSFWAGRKAAFPALGRLGFDYYCMDGTIPRRHLAKVLRRIGELSGEYGLGVANVFHAGDGNLHPLILYHAHRADELARAEALGARILELCVEVGGTVTGEHGVGMEKLDTMCAQFPSPELARFHAVKQVFDPRGLLNPGKGVPSLNRCAEYGAVHVHGGRWPHPELERF
ncbi:FAD-linked oxidase C-terminal domain-containing protein [Methylomagnum ishizawai]|uniref:FAD-linked oxidase C-terminal domain-containing protein n=1 Tax=Methylomagnum ishizawai TaxID=1760988 RepID=UPI001C32507C|nr:FAD-linked oxidase C-terminal domain-containing protein [Methylomagnum ishizawai]BBL73521.1 glycolate oxidase [Methylomagnum ishizawai]